MVTAVILPSNIRNHNGQAYADWSLGCIFLFSGIYFWGPKNRS
jgi:hypothetical protein